MRQFILKCFSRFEMRSIYNINFSANRSPLKTLVSRNEILVNDISAVNLIVWWCLFASSMNCVTWSLCIENISSKNLFQTSGLRALWLRI